MLLRVNHILYSLILILIVSSCVTKRVLEYVQDENDSIKIFIESAFKDYKLKPNDELYINISSLDEGAADIFSYAGSRASRYEGAMTPYGASLFSHTVDRQGYLMVPLIGDLFVWNKTIPEVTTILRDSLKNILSHPIVSVKLVNRYITIIGEVRNPGHFTYSQEKLTLFDAIGLAGDITDYGDRQNIILIRNENSENKRINLNLTRSEILSSPYLNLRPNDIVYVKPLSRRIWGMREFPFSIILSAITTGLLIYNVFR